MDNNSDFHSANSFCGNAGPEEMKHLKELLDELNLGELQILLENCGIGVTPNLDRESYEAVVDEADREDFYREYRKIMAPKKLKNDGH